MGRCYSLYTLWPKNEYTGSDSRLVAGYKASDGRTHRVIPTLVLYSNKCTPQAFQRPVLKAKAFFPVLFGYTKLYSTSRKRAVTYLQLWTDHKTQIMDIFDLGVLLNR